MPTASRAPGLRQSVSLGALPSTDQTQESAWVFLLFTRLLTASISFPGLSAGPWSSRWLLPCQGERLQEPCEPPGLNPRLGGHACALGQRVRVRVRPGLACSRQGSRGFCGRSSRESSRLAGVEEPAARPRSLCPRSPPLSGSEPLTRPPPRLAAPDGTPHCLAPPRSCSSLSLGTQSSLPGTHAPLVSPRAPQSVSGSGCCSHQSGFLPESSARALSNLGRPTRWGSLLAYPACPAHQGFHWPGTLQTQRLEARELLRKHACCWRPRRCEAPGAVAFGDTSRRAGHHCFLHGPVPLSLAGPVPASRPSLPALG